MRRVEPRALDLRNEPVPRQRNAVDITGGAAGTLFPSLEIDGPRKRLQNAELRDGHFGLLCQRHRRVEGVEPISREAEYKRPEDMHSVAPERAQSVDELVAGSIERLVDRLQS